MRLNHTLAIGLLSATLCVSYDGSGAQRSYVFQHENVLGTSLELKFAATTYEQAQQAEAAALDQIDRDAKILSTYDPTSEVSRWLKTKGEPVSVSAELYEVLDLFGRWRARTGGALDSSAEVAGQAWKKAAELKRLPTSEELAAAVKSMQRDHWRLDPAAHTATHLTDAPIRLNSFAKSWIAGRANDRAMDVDGVSAAVVNIGGDLVIRGRMTEEVSVVDPRADGENEVMLARLAVSNMAVATSGSYRRGVEIEGKHHSHIVDPRTGQAVDHIISATVAAPNAADAGALATAFSVLQPEESKKLAATVARAEYLLIARNGQRIESSGWRAIEMQRMMLAPAAAAQAAQQAGVWPTGYELVVNLELARVEGQRYKRPYVAIWIEDKDKFAVKTMALWVQKPKWIPDLKAWYHDDRMRSMAEGSELTGSFTSATRPAGKYAIKWDGKDNAGKLVKAGKYVVCVEVAREHGTYNVYRQEMDFSGVPKQVNLKPDTEVASASIDYRKAAH